MGQITRIKNIIIIAAFIFYYVIMWVAIMYYLDKNSYLNNIISFVLGTVCISVLIYILDKLVKKLFY